MVPWPSVWSGGRAAAEYEGRGPAPAIKTCGSILTVSLPAMGLPAV